MKIKCGQTQIESNNTIDDLEKVSKIVKEMEIARLREVVKGIKAKKTHAIIS